MLRGCQSQPAPDNEFAGGDYGAADQAFRRTHHELIVPRVLRAVPANQRDGEERLEAVREGQRSERAAIVQQLLQ
jgi:hypothetical protein